MKFCWSTLYVKDMEKSLRFYEGIVGLGIQRRFKTDAGTEFAFLGSGETQIELIFDPSRSIAAPGEDISWGFETESLEALQSELQEEGITPIGDPIQPNPQIRFLFVLDPNGLKVQFVEFL
ncbi:MAG: VOC family protein [Tissierellia bacterium]|nr:VOC family protein [Tissierellia bacterium]